MRILITALACAVAFLCWGNEKLSPRVYAFMHLRQCASVATTTADGASRAVPAWHDFAPVSVAGGVEMVEGFITLAEGFTTADVETAGVVVLSQLGQILVVQMPTDGLEQLAQLDAVQGIELAQRVRLMCEQARLATNVDMVHSGQGLGSPFDGTGVLVGVVDTGFDFNHINFKDEDGNTRVVRAASGGRTYSQSQIGRLTTDAENQTHGTHVAGIAAGSYKENGYYGMAPGASLYLAGLGDALSNSNIVTQMDKIAEYARGQNIPFVINLSLGENVGAHAGTNVVSQAIDQIVGEGAIVVISAGNEGDINLYLNKAFEQEDGALQMTTLCDISYNQTQFNTYTDQPVDFQFFAYNTETQEVLCESEMIENDNGRIAWSKVSIGDFGEYFDGSSGGFMVIENYYESSGKYQTTFYLFLKPKADNYKLGLRVFGANGDEINIWSDGYVEFTDGGNEQFTAGSTDCTINELATTLNAISAGAYVTKQSWTSINGEAQTSPRNEQIGHMATFSSYGTDMTGTVHPTIVAPGSMLSSSISRYYQVSIDNINSSVTVGSDTYQWFMAQGTSMSAPAVTGIIATWLQADPTLDPQQIKEIFAQTAIKGEYYGQDKAAQWGPNGLIDAYAGIQYLLSSGVNDVAKPQDVVLAYPNPTDGQFGILIPGEDDVHVELYTMGGAKAFSRAYSGVNGKIDIDLQGQLQSGIYTLKIKGSKKIATQKLIIK